MRTRWPPNFIEPQGTVLQDSFEPASRIELRDFRSPSMRAFHMAWMAFFLCFFAWFGIAPLMPIVREEFGLTKSQIGWCLIASVSITIIARLVVGWLCDRWGPRLTYTGLLILGSLPVMAIGLSHDFTSFLIFRLLIGVIGAAFVVTQVHTSTMFAPSCVGTANAMTAGWGNLGGGVTQFVMPLLYGVLVTGLGFTSAASWRLAMFAAGLVCLLTGIAYYFLTQDRVSANTFKQSQNAGRNFRAACADPRTWVLFVVYGACFGIELTIDNIAVMYFTDRFEMGLLAAGWCAGLFGAMNLFARALGGMVSDRVAQRWGSQARVLWLCATLLSEGLLLMCFASAGSWLAAIGLLMAFGLFVKMSNGATYAVVPFLKREGLGAVSGIVGAGGNAGAVAFGFLLKEADNWSTSLLWLGVWVTFCAVLALTVRLGDWRSLSAPTESPSEASLARTA